MNIIFAGDLWQLPPVLAIALMANPFRPGYSPAEQNIFRMFWRRDEDSIQQTFELTESKRTKDTWLEAVLQADRQGEDTYDMYCFTHGLPTNNPGSWNPTTKTVECGRAHCMTLAAKWEDELLGPARKKWAERQVEECTECQAERKRRNIIISTSAGNLERVKRAPFNTAAYVHHFRYPSAHSQQLRAIAFVKEKSSVCRGRQLSTSLSEKLRRV